MSEGTATIAPTEALKIDEDRLAEYLRGVLPAASGPMRLKLFSHGQSNPTYFVSFDDASYVVRKQPPGELLPSAHAVDREHRVQKALHAQGFPVAEQFHFCEERSIVGTPFYVMEKMEGRVFTDSSLPGCTPDERRAMYLSRKDFETHGFTDGCVGCRDISSGKKRTGSFISPHTTACRKRMEAAVRATDPGRWCHGGILKIKLVLPWV